MARCVVCEKDSSRYRCRMCRSPYCSAACHKAHRDPDALNHCSKLRQPGTDEEPQLQKEDEATVAVAPGVVGEVRSMKRERESDGSFIYGERDEDGELVVLGEAHLAALAQNAGIRKKLRSEELQRLLRVIDSSRSCIDALEAAMANTPEFKAFCDDVLGAVAAAERDLKPRVL
ncbi:zinc finger family protein [Trypanosoma grayi]|uniref:zinc finger family protein n=1 Tax=Trypanosoma grayi TaxID=71804 RepID=UPI0004F448C1|nr:zinc finger family protein [Trypanosoma grayi]KEG08612.1 zinc finger family protein [Trypanosoma grayi]